MSESMIERVAKAQLAAMDKWAAENGKYWHETPALVVARAAIEAMRSPTPEMVKVIADHSYSYVEQGHIYDEFDADPATLADGAPAEIWQAMIDAALLPHHEGEGSNG